jgi:ABC-2 type transport system ATP-binding protein
MNVAIETKALRKVYGEKVVAVDSLDLTVPEGEFFGLLGPNGAGKTTTIGILTTRIRATSGEAHVSGANVSTQSADARQRIGVVPQRPNPDRGLRVAENLIFHATYFGVSRAVATKRAMELLEKFGISDKKDAKVDALSGGQNQRLMIARALIHEPRVLFLDEPTVGLDPQARLAFWDVLREVHAQGRTIIMTTHYMEEADQLCDRIAIMDQGKLIALDTPAKLKEKAPGDTMIDVTLDADSTPLVAEAQNAAGVTRVEARGPVLRVFTSRVGEAVPAILALAELRGHTVHDIQLSRPSLETLFISLTGRKLS